jgi:hypothetical protein
VSSSSNSARRLPRQLSFSDRALNAPFRLIPSAMPKPRGFNRPPDVDRPELHGAHNGRAEMRAECRATERGKSTRLATSARWILNRSKCSMCCRNHGGMPGSSGERPQAPPSKVLYDLPNGLPNGSLFLVSKRRALHLQSPSKPRFQNDILK